MAAAGLVVAAVITGGSVYGAIQLFKGTSVVQWYNMSWRYRIKITVDHTKVGETLSDFPVYLDMSDLPDSFFSEIKPDGSDIRITNDSGVLEVPREIVSLDTAAHTGEIDFKATNLLPNTDSSFYIYYGNASAATYSATSPYGRNNVWTNNFLAVYHMGEDPSGTAPQMVDSTGNGYDGTSNGTMTDTDVVSGQMGESLQFDGSDDDIALDDFMPTGPVTFSAWLKTTSSAEMGIVGKLSYWTDNYGYGLYMKSGKPQAIAANNQPGSWQFTAPAVNDGGWHYAAFTLDGWGAGTTGDLYTDGMLSSSLVDTASLYSGYAATVGNSDHARYFSGALDEIRVSPVARSAAWVAATYADQHDSASFYHLGSVDAPPGSASDRSARISQGSMGLVGEWKLDGNAKDATPYSNDGVVTGATPTTDRKGAASSAYSFDGSGDYIATTMTATPGAGTTNAFTICAWAKGTQNQSIVRQQSASPYAYIILDYHGSHVDAVQWDGGTTGLPSGIPDDNQWHFGCMEWQRNTPNGFKTFADGQIVAQRNSLDVAIPQMDTPFYIGSYHGTSEYDIGSIDDVRVYDRALSAQEIANQYSSYESQINLYKSGTTAAGVNLTAGLVGYWPFNGSAKDATPYSHNGTVTGAVLVTDKQGRADSAYSFNGSGQYIDAGPNPITGASPFTLAAWIDTTQVSRYSGALTIGASGSGASAYIGTVNTAQIGTSDSIGGGFYGSNVGSGITTTGQWVHVALTFDGTTGTMYVNGTATNTFPFTPSLSGASLRIGRIGSDTTYDFSGSIDDVRLYNRALSAAEVSALQSYQY